MNPLTTSSTKNLPKVKVALAGAQETLLGTLYCKWYDTNQAPRSILGDPWAGYVLRQLDYDFSRLGMNYVTAATIALRARNFDDWTVEFAKSHLVRDSSVTVLHLGCGLDGRPQRVEARLQNLNQQYLERVHWIDVDLVEAASLRRRLLPSPALFGSYAVVGTSVTDSDVSWLTSIPVNNPTLIVMEGLMMYLPPDAGKLLIQHLIEHFSIEDQPGQLVFDTLGSPVVRLQRFVALMRATGATFLWAIDSAAEITKLHKRLRVRDDTLMCERVGRWELPWVCLLLSIFCAWIPFLRYLGHDIRLDF